MPPGSSGNTSGIHYSAARPRAPLFSFFWLLIASNEKEIHSMCRGEAGISPVFGLNVKCFLSNPLTASVYGQFPVKFHSTVPVFLLPLLFIDVIF